MTIYDVIQDILDVKEWEFSEVEDEIFSPITQLDNGKFVFYICVKNGYIGVGKNGATYHLIYFMALTEDEMRIVKKIYRTATEKKLEKENF